MDLLKHTKEAADYFATDLELPDTKEEIEAMLFIFGSGIGDEALDWASKHIIYSADANGNEQVKAFAANMVMTLRAVMSR